MASRNVQGRIANAKSIGWAIYVAGFAIWLFGYLSAGHAPVFDWKGATPWWISSFVPNLEAELGIALMFASMIPIYGRAVRGNLARLPPTPVNHCEGSQSSAGRENRERPER